ncbi:hypothetical protein ABZ883_35600 [Streptomyces sp. NPDC046977]|uniref:hypothetical protein n=1 Tax=Streptomyces sp. NPDC046977 TaxID=3154703 RepID=UPI00340EEFDC
MTAQTPPTGRLTALPRRSRGQALHDIQRVAPAPRGEAGVDLIAALPVRVSRPKDAA